MAIDWGTVAQESVFAIGVSATWARDLRLHRSGLVDVTMRAGTRVQLRVDAGGLFLFAEPPLPVKLRGPLPDVAFDTASYDFHRARFDVRSDAGLVGPVLDVVVERYLNGTLRRRLPPALLRRDYAPQRDPDLAGTVRGTVAMLPLGGDGGDGGETAAPGLPEELHHARDLAAHLTLHTRRDLAVPAPGLDELEVFVPKGARLFVDVRTSGPAARPRLDSVVVKADGPGVTIRSTGDGLLDALTSLEITRITIEPGPRLRFDYDLLIERLVNAPLHLARFAEVLAGRYGAIDAPEIRIDALRPKVDSLLDEAVGGLLRDLLAEYDGVLPGVSLRAIFA